MKKLLPCLLMLILALACLTTAAPALEAGDVVGEWHLYDVLIFGESIIDLGEGNLSLVLEADGNAFTQTSGAKPETGSWRLSEGILIVELESGTMTFTLADGLLSYDAKGLTRVFSRERTEYAAYVRSPAVSADELSQFDGEWTGIIFYAPSSLEVSLQPSGDPAYALSIAAGEVRLHQLVEGEETVFSVQGVLEDGALTATREADGVTQRLQLRLREDGTLTLSLRPDNGNNLIYFARAEAE